MQFSPPLSSPSGDPDTPTRRLSLCNDLVFKVLFSSQLPLLTDLINAVLHPAPPITVRRILNPTILPADLASKNIVLDILAEDANGQRLGIEMQLQRFLHWPQRNIYGVARTLASQLQSGQDYRLLKPAIGISLLVHDLFDQHPDKACWRFTLRDEGLPTVQLDPGLQVHIIELRKAEQQTALPAPLQAWIACLLHNLDEAAMRTITHPPVKAALKELDKLYADEDLRLAAERREQALVDAEDMVDYARKEALAEMLATLLQTKFGETPAWAADRIKKGKPTDLHRWTLRILNAQRLEDVFA